MVGTDRLSESGYFRAKIVQERLIRESGRSYSIVHATQFYEFVMAIADLSTVDGKIPLPPVLIQPMAADDVGYDAARYSRRFWLATRCHGTERRRNIVSALEHRATTFQTRLADLQE